MSKGNGSVKVACLWQGSDAGAYVEQLTEGLQKVWTAKGYAALQFDMVSEAQRGESYLELAIGVMAKCHCAIAIQGRDNRPAQSSGNLWLEIGHWYADRSGNDELRIVQTDDRRRFGWIRSLLRGRSLPSNIRGWPSINFDDPDKYAMLVQWLEGVAKARNLAPSEDIRRSEGRVRATLGDPFAEWIKQHYEVLEMCPQRKWGRSVAALTFIAEGLRIARGMGELADFATQLNMIGRTAAELAQLDDSRPALRNAIAQPQDREEGEARKVAQQLRDLCFSSKRELFRYKTPRPTDKEAWIRLEDFLRRRLEAFANSPSDKWRIKNAELLSVTELEEFIFSAEQFADEDWLLRSLRRSPATHVRTRTFKRAKVLSDSASKLAAFLDTIRFRWQRETRDAMSSWFQTARLDGASSGEVPASQAALVSLSTLGDSLASLSERLPHNLPSKNAERLPIRVWPKGLS